MSIADSKHPQSRAELLEQLIQAMRKSSAQGVLLSQAVADKVGLGSADMQCLELLSNSGSVTAGELGDLTGLTSGAVTALIDRLEKAGYVQRTRDINDRRRVIVQPLPKSEQDVGPLYEGLLHVVEVVCSRYTDEQLMLMLDFLNQLIPAFSQEIAVVGEREAKGALTSTVGGDFAASLASSSGQLIFDSYFFGISIFAAPLFDGLYRAHFEPPIPSVQVQQDSGTVTLRSGRFSFTDFLSFWMKLPAQITLNASIPWSIEFRGGISRITADLSQLTQLKSLEARDGLDETDITLPQPTGTVLLRCHSGVNNLTLSRPAGVAIRVSIRKFSNNLRLDHVAFEANKRSLSWATPDYASAANRYDVELIGAVNSLTVDTY